MTTSLLLDTNVIIDYLGRKPPFFDDAKNVIAAGYFGDAKLWMAAQSAKDAFYILSKYVSSAAVQRALLRLFEVVEPVSLTAADLTRAAQLEWSDYEDCLIALSAQKADATHIVTRDARGFALSPVSVITPAQWTERASAASITYDETDL